MYNDLVIDHFNHPRNLGEPDHYSVRGEAKCSECGDTTFIYLLIEDNIIKEAHFKTFGCAAAIASASMLTTLLLYKSIEAARSINEADLIEALGGLPELKMSCASLPIAALDKAVAEYQAEKQDNDEQ